MKKGIAVILGLTGALFLNAYSEASFYKVNTYALNVRSSNSYDSKITDVIYKGQVIDVENIKLGWAKVKTSSGKDGYVVGKFLVKVENDNNILSSDLNTKKTINSSDGLSVFKVIPTKVKVRSEKSNEKILAILNKGDELSLLDQNLIGGHWYKVKVINSSNPANIGVQGIIYKDLIEKVSDGMEKIDKKVSVEQPVVEEKKLIDVVSTQGTLDSTGNTQISDKSMGSQNVSDSSGEDVDLNSMFSDLLK